MNTLRKIFSAGRYRKLGHIRMRNVGVMLRVISHSVNVRNGAVPLKWATGFFIPIGSGPVSN